MPSQHTYVIYIVQGLTAWFCSTRRYVGCVRVRLEKGETAEEALERRKKEHEGGGVTGALWLRICKSPLKITLVGVEVGVEAALASELWTTVRLWVEFGAAVRGGPFSSITMPPEMAAELRALAAYPHRLDPALFPLSCRHLRGLCFHCGSRAHVARECGTAAALERRWAHNPAEFDCWGGCYWERDREAYRMDVRSQRGKVRTLRARVVCEAPDAWYVQQGCGGPRCGPLPLRWHAVQEAREACLRMGGGAQHKRAYEWCARPAKAKRASPAS